MDRASTESNSCRWLLNNVFNKPDIKANNPRRFSRSLTDLVIDKIIQDSHTCKEARYVLPTGLLEKLLAAALIKERDLSVIQLVKAWKHPTLKLSFLLSHLQLGNYLLRPSYHNRANQGDNKLNRIIWTLLHVLKQYAPDTLKNIDLSGLPIVYVCEYFHKKSKNLQLNDHRNRLTRSNILKQLLEEKGITTTIDISVHTFRDWDKVTKGTIIEAPRGICIQDCDILFFQQLEQYPPLAYKEIKRLSILMNINMSFDFFQCANMFSNLEELSIAFDRRANVSYHAFLELKNLKRLLIRTICPGELAKLMEHCNYLPHLQCLQTYSVDLNSKDLEALSKCTSLQQLILHSSGSNMNELQALECLKKSVAKLPQLEYLVIDLGSSAVTTTYVQGLVSKCPRLLAFTANMIVREDNFDVRPIMEEGVMRWFMMSYIADDDDMAFKSEEYDDYTVITRYDGRFLENLLAYNNDYTPPKDYFEF
eukprot:TRINITY_DN6562_c0_g1_i2.p1 TRINITY_DN6562_c0_g1~~TRINITY_DN6562_c0_g1_i2.p1  ORF type:complete len:479 (+),score=57.25 TRINITY_DN6562_c0_g1_i2:28-1464(+)